jgi:cytochrome c oxidase subunit III
LALAVLEGGGDVTVRPDLPRLPVYVLGSKSVVWWGMVGLLAIETTVILGMIAMYFWLKLVNPAFPPEGIDVPDLFLPTLNTAVLLASGVAMLVAKRAIVRGDQRTMAIAQLVALLLAATFVGIKIVEYSGYDYDWSTHAYGSITWTMTGFHFGHVVSILLKGTVTFAMTLRGMFRPDRHLAFEVGTLYWVFVVLIWLPLYFTMYISPRL